MLDDLKMIHMRDSQDLLGKAQGKCETVVAELADAIGVHDTDFCSAISKKIETQIAVWLPTVPSAKNLAKQLALECMGKGVVLYASPATERAAHEWKVAFRRLAKQPTWQVWFPSEAEDDLFAWSAQAGSINCLPIWLRSSREDEVSKQCFERARRMLSGRWLDPEVVWAEGEDHLEQLAWLRMLGEFTALYLALVSGRDPSKSV